MDSLLRQSAPLARPWAAVWTACILAASLGQAADGPAAAAGDLPWPRYRGPNGSGVQPDATPPAKFGLAENVLWKQPAPSGFSSPVVAKGKVFLTAFEDGKLWTLCLRLADGGELWRRQAPAETLEPYHKTEGSPAASSPATDGTRVVSYFGSAGLFAYDLDGRELWRAPMPVAATQNDFGSGVSPILEDGLVVLVRDLRDSAAVLAFHAADGKLAWKTDRSGFLTGWGSPIVWENAGQRELIVPGGLRLKSYDFRTGAELWTVRELAAVNCTTPVLAEGRVVYAGWSPGNEDSPWPPFSAILGDADADSDGAMSKEESKKTPLADFFDANDVNKDGKLTSQEWETQGEMLKKGRNRLVAVDGGGRGDVTDSKVAWSQAKGLPYVPSPICCDGKVLLLRDGGLLTQFDAKTGKPDYQQERLPGAGGSYYASPVAADGRIYVVSLQGKLSVLAAGPKLNVLQQVDFGERVAATPALAGGLLLVRTASQLYAFGQP